MKGDECHLTGQGLKKFFTEWETMQKTMIMADCEDGKIELGLLPFLQAQKLSRTLYGREDEYRPFRTEG